MKSIAVVTDGHSDLGDFLTQNLKEIFDNYININNYYFKNLKKDDIINDDLILVMIKQRALEIQNYVNDSKKIIVIERTIKEAQINSLLSIPKNTNVLVVNDNFETTLETVSLLYQLGINHIKLIPYNPNKEYKQIKIAITPGEKKRVPTYIEKIIDIGNRCIDISTFVKIINMLNITNKEINKRLFKYSDTIIPIDRGIKNQYKEIIIKNEQLDTILNLSNDGILLINNDNIIELYNKTFTNMFKISNNITGTSIEKIFKKDVIDFLKKTPLKDELLEYQNKFINVKKTITEYMGEKTGYLFNFQEVTYIKQLEQNLSKKLAEKGQIARYTFYDITTKSANMKECITLAKKIANSDLTVLITGESGTGKELIAQSIHNASKRQNQPFIAINCAALPESLLESELFGYEGGSFTGALKEGKAGLFEQAHNGTIFLDEIGDMPLSLQARLLRVIQERQVMRIGSPKVINVNIRIIGATNKNLFEMVQKGKFRDDLYYRLNVLPIYVPPLRNRKEDIMLLLETLIDKNKKLIFTDEAKNLLLNYDWPGNVRELQNTALYLELMSNTIVKPENLPSYILNNKIDFELLLNNLKKSTNIEKALKILEIIQNNNKNSKGIGRNAILKYLSDEDIYSTEGEIRSVLNALNKLKLIISSVGRKGSQLTYDGKQFLNWYKNRLNKFPK